MTKFLVGISTICLLLLTACGVAVMLEARALIRDVRSDVASIDRETVETLTLVKQAAGNANTASSQLAGAAQEQRTYWNKTGLETYKTIAAARLLIVRTDTNVNDVLAPHLETSITDLQNNLAEIKKATVTFNQVLTDTDGVIADPKIREILANLADSTQELTASIKQLDAMLVSGSATAEDIRRVADKVAEQYTKARSLYYVLFKELLSMGGSAAQMIK